VITVFLALFIIAFTIFVEGLADYWAPNMFFAILILIPAIPLPLIVAQYKYLLARLSKSAQNALIFFVFLATFSGMIMLYPVKSEFHILIVILGIVIALCAWGFLMFMLFTGKLDLLDII